MLREKPMAEDVSVQFDDDDEPPTPQPILTGGDDNEKTQRKPYPRKEGTKGE
jgi:hypothetical protein